MALEKSLASGKRFGTRYGRRIRHKFSAIEAEQRKKHKCPYCNEPKVTRISFGIWSCTKCGSKFTGKAYTIPKAATIKEDIPKKEEFDAEAEEISEDSEETKEEQEEKPKKYKEAKIEADPEEFKQDELGEEEPAPEEIKEKKKPKRKKKEDE